MKQRLYFIFASSVMLVLLATGCSRDNEAYQPSEEEVMANAEDVLGVKISSDLDWNMTASARASITVNGNFGETYTVKIYSNDPLVDGKGYVLKRGQVESGGTFEVKFDYPSASSRLMVGVSDSKGFTSYKSVAIVDGLLETTFGGDETAGARTTRSREMPSVPDITIPTSEYAKSFLTDAKEPTDANVVDNYDDSVYVPGGTYVPGNLWGWGFNGQSVGGKLYYNSNNFGQSWFNYEDYGATKEQFDWFLTYCMPYVNKDWAFYNADNENDAVTELITLIRNAGYSDWINVWQEGSKGHYEGDGESTEGYWNYDETYVKKFKITGTWDKLINVLATEKGNGDARTVYISGKWSLSNLGTGNDGKPITEQRVGGGAVIVVDEGGELVIPEGKQLTFVNEARLVVMPGGTVSGAGTIVVTNGNAVGLEGYNGGTINVGKFNNNFGKFHNYGNLYAGIYAAGAGESNFYNHGVAQILSTYETNEQNQPYDVSANARIYNACQWICVNDMRAYIVENTMGSYFKVGGQLMMSIGKDGTNDPSYVALGKGALVRLGSLYNNASDWIGPTNGTAVLEIGQVNYLNWDFQNTPKHGYFINNIAITLSNKQNTCDGNNVRIAEYGEDMTAYQKMNVLLINGTGGDKNYMGNGGTVFVEENGANVFVPVDGDFVEGVKGCTPGYNGKGRNIYDEPAVWTYAFEDTPLGDYDMNDVVIKVSENADDPGQLEVYLCCVGASFDLYLYFGETALFYGKEIHDAFGQARGVLINTGGGGPEVDITKMQPAYVDKPDGFSFADADFWVKSPLVPEGIHVAKKGEAPLGVAIPGDWLWPLAGVNIEEAYPNFIEFAKDVEKADENARKWYVTTDTNPVRDKVFVLANSSWQ